MNNMTAIGEALKNAFAPYVKIQEALNEVLAPIRKSLEQITKVMWPFKVLSILCESQYVEWSSLDRHFADALVNSSNPNKTLIRKHQKDGYRTIQNDIKWCKKHKAMKPYKRVFAQAVLSFENGDTELSIVGLIAILDGLTSDITKNPITNIKKKMEPFINKVSAGEWKEIEGISDFILIYTYTRTLETFTEFHDFREKEPDKLNRNWIMHGRSRKRITKLDCIKVMRLIYGTLLINDLSIA